MPLKKINRKNKTLKKQAPKKNAHKRTHRQRPKNEQTQTQNVYINTYRQQRAQSSVRKSNHNTISTPIIVPFVQPLPPGHHFNNNAPHNQSGVDVRNPVNPTLPSAGALAADVGAVPPQTPAPQRPAQQTPAPLSPIPMPLPSAKKEKKERAERGKRLKYDPNDAEPDSAAGVQHLKTIAHYMQNNTLQGRIIEELKQMAKAEGYKIPSKGKNKILSAIKKQYYERTKT